MPYWMERIMGYQNIRATGFATLLVATALTMSEGQAAQIAVSATDGNEQAEQEVAIPRARPDAQPGPSSGRSRNRSGH